KNQQPVAAGAIPGGRPQKPRLDSSGPSLPRRRGRGRDRFRLLAIRRRPPLGLDRGGVGSGGGGGGGDPAPHRSDGPRGLPLPVASEPQMERRSRRAVLFLPSLWNGGPLPGQASQ